ncbi:MAG: GMC family oxidoreductase N-terminal domain-containing protein [Burkholderiaceae bacterium]
MPNGATRSARPSSAPWPRTACADNDYNGASQRGTGYYQRFIDKARRITAASAFLHPAMTRPNLAVRTGMLATRVLVENGRASGIEYRPADGTDAPKRVMARAEVILSAGTVNPTG